MRNHQLPVQDRHAEPRARRGDPTARQDLVGPHAPILQLQRAAGNRAVTAMLGQRAAPVQRCGDVPADQCPCHQDADQDGDVGSSPAAALQRDGAEAAIADDEPMATGSGSVRSGTTITLTEPVTHAIDGTTPQEIEANASGAMDAGHVEIEIGMEADTDGHVVTAAAVTVSMTKHTFTWGSGRDEATEAHRRIIDRFFTLINAHEERHIAGNRAALRNAHRVMLRKPPAQAQAALDAKECDAAHSDERLDAAEGCVRFTTNHADAELVGLEACGFDPADYSSHLSCPDG